MVLDRLGGRSLRVAALGAAVVVLAGCTASVDVGGDAAKEPSLGALVFDARSVNHRPVAPQASFPVGTASVFGFLRTEAVDPDAQVAAAWLVGGRELVTQTTSLRQLAAGGTVVEDGVAHVDFELHLGAVGGFPPGRYGLRVSAPGLPPAEGAFEVGDGSGFGPIVFAPGTDAEGVPLGARNPATYDAGIPAIYGIVRLVGVPRDATVNATWSHNGAAVWGEEFAAATFYGDGEGVPIGWGSIPLRHPAGLPEGSYRLDLRAAGETTSGEFELA